MKPSDPEFGALAQVIGNSILTKINASAKWDIVINATTKIYGRMVAGGNSLIILEEHAKTYDWMIDGATIVRAIYDAMFQALHILQDSKRSVALATKFFDYRIIEKVKMIQVFDQGKTRTSRQMSTSSKREAIEPKLIAEYERVCDLYDYRRGTYPPNWYSHLQLKDLAELTPYASEYEVFHRQLNMAVHCSPEAVDGHYPMNARYLLYLYWKFAFRVLDKLVAYYEISLSTAEQAMIETSRLSPLD